MEVADNCITCGACLVYCPMGAISLGREKAEIDQDDCVECSVCYRSAVCPTDSFIRSSLLWPRNLRRIFSDPGPVHETTGVPGRGTEEMKTNDVTGRYRLGAAGICLDIGRPGIGARFKDIETIYRHLYKLDVRMERNNPVAHLLNDINGWELNPEVLNEKVMSAIIEFIIPIEKLAAVLLELKQIEDIDTVFSVGIIDRVAADGSMLSYEIAKQSGFTPSINAKVCLGVGRPLAII